MNRLAAAIGALQGWRRAAAALMAGVLSVLAMAPFEFFPILFITFPALVWLMDGCAGGGDAAAVGRAREALCAGLTGWFFGFGYFLAGLYWIGSAFLVEADEFGWLLPFAVALLPAGLAIFYAAATALASLAWCPGPARVVALAGAFMAAEYARGHVLTGFPWNTLGYALTDGETMMQWASVFGVYALTALAVLIFSAPATIWSGHWAVDTRWPGRFGLAITAVLLLGGAYTFGAVRLASGPTEEVPGVRLRVVQPNIPQKDKWKPGNTSMVFNRLLDISRSRIDAPGAGLRGITHLIWPESSVPFLLADNNVALTAVANLLPEDTVLIVGAARGETDFANGGDVRERRIYNSIFVMDDQARILDSYDKVRLVPFGEFLPFQTTLEAIGLEQLTRQRGGFAAGAGRRHMRPPGAPPFSPLICYEIIFPEDVRGEGDRPEWLLNLTNDAWFGATSGPYQHFHQARVRAVEQGLPVVRAANSGVSAVIDPYGRVVERLPLNWGGALDSGLPVALPATIFVKWGRFIDIAIIVLLGIAWAFLASGYWLDRRLG
jgi:apolipoprotein N-acyltransferase